MIEATELNLDLSVIQALQPTTMSIVPRVMERLWNVVLEVGSNRETGRAWKRSIQMGRSTVAAIMAFAVKSKP